MRLSVVVPCYENDSYLLTLYDSYLRSLSKIENQHDVELIFLDDCSSNNKIKEIASSFEKASYIRNENNIGLFANWNKSFSIANYEYVLVLSQDDYLHEDYFKLFFKTLQDYKDLDLVFTDFQCFNEEGEFLHRMKAPFGLLTKNDCLEYLSRHGFGLPGISMAIKKSVFLGSQGYDTKNMGSNDWELYYRGLEWKVAFGIDKPLVFYRKHDESASKVYSIYCSLSQYYIYSNVGKRKLNNIFYWLKASKSYHLLSERDETNKYLIYFESSLKNNLLYNFIHNSKLSIMFFRLLFRLKKLL
ncbi:hypothetical protein VCR14J2_270187 [Vibrio coralliirubri]|uniref:glycosyltransferase family 2 protein n=1 Tax=Vibrio coralliirubri TaxID=1516159 RepID=UPI000634EB4C|nr:glycosyltransferase family 2 protein [Vibrio coralliirubri]CDT99977.1 hypothetical protein VCR14J2_270187 [Vibrio coralliirubri]